MKNGNHFHILYIATILIHDFLSKHLSQKQHLSPTCLLGNVSLIITLQQKIINHSRM